MRESVVLLHGFGGTHRAWDGVMALLPGERYRPLALDLPGHGAASAQRPITFESCIRHVLDLAPERFVLCGYSMGGRIALSLALSQPLRVSRLVLVSTSPGLQDPAAREERVRSDERLARELEAGPYEAFIERWRGQPLFASEPPEVGELARADHLRNDPQALAEVLRGVGTGRMYPLWDRLGELSMPVAVLAGTRDEKYQHLAQRMVARIPEGRLLIVPGGHSLALENPAALAGALHPV